MSELILICFSIGIIGGLLTMFYDHCLADGMIFNLFYTKVLVRMRLSRCRWLRMLSMPLGLCIYSTSFWVTLFLFITFMTTWNNLPCWQDMVIGLGASIGAQHLVVLIIIECIVDDDRSEEEQDSNNK